MNLKELLANLLLQNSHLKKLSRAGLKEKYPKYIRLTAKQKQDIIDLVEDSDIGINRSLIRPGIAKSIF